MLKRSRRRWFLVAGGLLVAFALFVFFNNVSFGAGGAKPRVLAHRGLAQTFPVAGLENDTCTAERIDPPRHRYLENTIASIDAAYDAGADVVEFDVHRTADDDFAVFHDWDVGCRTDGSGKVEEHTMAELRELDIGHGYTADDGRTHPFRGKGVGLMPSLDQVFDRFGGRELLLHLKSGVRVTGPCWPTGSGHCRSGPGST